MALRNKLHLYWNGFRGSTGSVKASDSLEHDEPFTRFDALRPAREYRSGMMQTRPLSLQWESMATVGPQHLDKEDPRDLSLEILSRVVDTVRVGVQVLGPIERSPLGLVFEQTHSLDELNQDTVSWLAAIHQVEGVSFSRCSHPW